MEEQSKERDRVEPDKGTRLSGVAKKTVNGVQKPGVKPRV